MSETPIQIYDSLQNLDFYRVKYKLGKAGYDEKMVERMLKECLRFLAILASNNDPKRQHTPSPLVDECWHQLILNTPMYVGDISRVCGRYIHHLPNGSKEDKARNDNFSFWNTINDYEKYFGEPDMELWGLKRKETTGGEV